MEAQAGLKGGMQGLRGACRVALVTMQCGQAALAGEGLEPWQSILIGENHALLTTEGSMLPSSGVDLRSYATLYA